MLVTFVKISKCRKSSFRSLRINQVIKKKCSQNEHLHFPGSYVYPRSSRISPFTIPILTHFLSRSQLPTTLLQSPIPSPKITVTPCNASRVIPTTKSETNDCKFPAQRRIPLDSRVHLASSIIPRAKRRKKERRRQVGRSQMVKLSLSLSLEKKRRRTIRTARCFVLRVSTSAEQ